MKKRYFLFILCVLVSFSGFAQKAERDFLRKGNRQYKDSLFVDAEVSYRRALEVNSQSVDALYNIGNALMEQEKYEDAITQFGNAAKVEESRQLERDKSKLGQIYHNIGTIYMAGEDYAKAVEAYKMSLRNNSKDDETRYNLALAQKKLQDQQNQDQQNQDENQDQKEDQQQEQEQQKQQDQDQNQDQQQQNNQNEQEQRENEMSKENAEQLLNSVMQDEKDTQEKMQKQQIIQGGQLEKDW